MDIREENRKIREKRVKRGKYESRIYPVLHFIISIVCAVLCESLLIPALSAILVAWLFFGVPFGRMLYSWGNLAYGFYILYVFCYDLPIKGAEAPVIIALLVFMAYIIFSAIRVFKSEGVKAYLYEKNSD